MGEAEFSLLKIVINEFERNVIEDIAMISEETISVNAQDSVYSQRSRPYLSRFLLHVDNGTSVSAPPRLLGRHHRHCRWREKQMPGAYNYISEPVLEGPIHG